MSIEAYLKLIPKAFKNREEIVDSIITKVKEKIGTLTDAEKEEIIKRKLLCHTCDFNSTNATEKDNYINQLGFEHCVLCSCNLNFKTESLMSNCGIEIWNKNNPNEQLPLKWEAYKTK